MKQRQKTNILTKALISLLFCSSLCAVSESMNKTNTKCKQAFTAERYTKAIKDFRSLFLLGEFAFALKDGEDLFIGETGLKTLNPLYYENLAEMLYPIFKSNQQGIIAVSTVREAYRLTEFLSRAFTQMKFSPYYEGMDNADKQKIINAFQSRRTSYHSHYIVMVGDFDKLLVEKSLPYLSSYIDLNGNTTFLQKLDQTLWVYPGQTSSEVLFLLNPDFKIETEIGKVFAWSEIKKKISSSSRHFEEKMIDLGWQGQSSKTRNDLAKKGAVFIKQETHFLSYKRALQKVQSFGLRSNTEYQVWQKDHPDMPGNPEEFFRDKGWTNWYDFLGKVKPPTKSKTKLLFEEAQQKVQSFGLRSRAEYRVWQKDHPDMPGNPEEFYRDKGWTNWYDFLGKVKPP
ncbi:MAG: hypothetical protein OXB86_07405, partial [Bdellovibrionales bacterium]|nr:hypothetical protein [Bdellovibrionales bacterium]